MPSSFNIKIAGNKTTPFHELGVMNGPRKSLSFQFSHVLTGETYVFTQKAFCDFRWSVVSPLLCLDKARHVMENPLGRVSLSNCWPRPAGPCVTI